MARCIVCQGLGSVGGCPRCGTVLERVTRTLTEAEQKTNLIPPNMKGVEWSSLTFWTDHESERKNHNTVKVVMQLEKIYGNYYSKGINIDRSVLLIAPGCFGKTHFVYACMRKAILSGLSCTPYYDTQEVKRIFGLSGEKPYSEYGMRYENLVKADVCFVTVCKSEQRRLASSVLSDLIDKRSRVGKPTFVMSRFAMSELTRYDNPNSLAVMASAARNDSREYDALKAITVISV